MAKRVKKTRRKNGGKPRSRSRSTITSRSRSPSPRPSPSRSRSRDSDFIKIKNAVIDLLLVLKELFPLRFKQINANEYNNIESGYSLINYINSVWIKTCSTNKFSGGVFTPDEKSLLVSKIIELVSNLKESDRAASIVARCSRAPLTDKAKQAMEQFLKDLKLNPNPTSLSLFVKMNTLTKSLAEA